MSSIRHGVARVISKLGIASRSQAALWVRAGRVSVNGRVVTDPEFPVRDGVDKLEIQGAGPSSGPRRAIMLNKPRGLLTTTSDEQGRATVYSCLAGADLPWLAPVGRLDKASEGLLVLCNDPEWAARITSPETGPAKTYHVQVDCIPAGDQLAAIVAGVSKDGEFLRAAAVRLLRHGQRNSWLEVVLDEGRNRQIRRLLEALDISVLRLVRVAIGPLELGNLAKGQWRELEPSEMALFEAGR